MRLPAPLDHLMFRELCWMGGSRCTIHPWGTNNLVHLRNVFIEHICIGQITNQMVKWLITQVLVHLAEIETSSPAYEQHLQLHAVYLKTTCLTMVSLLEIPQSSTAVFFQPGSEENTFGIRTHSGGMFAPVMSWKRCVAVWPDISCRHTSSLKNTLEAGKLSNLLNGHMSRIFSSKSSLGETSNQQSLPQESFQCTPSICNLSISTTENPRSLEGTHALTKDAISLWMYWYTNVGYGMLKSERTFTSWHVMVYSKRKLGYSTVVGNSFRSLWHGIAWTPSCWVSWIQKNIQIHQGNSRDIKGLRLLKGGWNVMQPATTIRLDTCWKFWNFHDDPTELKMEHLLQHHGLKHLRQLLVSKLLMQHLDMEQLWSAIPCYPSCFNFFYSVRCALRLALKRVWSLKFVTALTALLLILVLKYLP